MSRIKILHCIRQGQIGGGESHVLDLVSSLDSSLFSCSVLAFTDGPMMAQLHKLGVPSVVIPTRFPFDFRVWKKVSVLVKKNQIDLIHIHGTRAFSNCILAAKANNIPIIYTVHGWSFHVYQSFIRNKLSILIERYFTRVAKAVVNVSENNRQFGLNFIHDLKSEVIQNGIDTTRFNPSLPLLNLRSELNISATKTVIGFIARLTKQKDPITMIKAFHLLTKKSEGDNFVLLIVGEGDLTSTIHNLVDKLELRDKVHFEKFRGDVPNILATIDIYCLPSLWEGLPLGLLEAMALKKIVVASLVDGTKEVIEHGKNGYLFTPENHEQLSEVLLESSIANEKNTQIRERAWETVQSHFTRDNMIAQIQQVYLNVFNSPT